MLYQNRAKIMDLSVDGLIPEVDGAATKANMAGLERLFVAFRI